MLPRRLHVGLLLVVRGPRSQAGDGVAGTEDDRCEVRHPRHPCATRPQCRGYPASRRNARVVAEAKLEKICAGEPDSTIRPLCITCTTSAMRCAKLIACVTINIVIPP